VFLLVKGFYSLSIIGKVKLGCCIVQVCVLEFPNVEEVVPYCLEEGGHYLFACNG